MEIAQVIRHIVCWRWKSGVDVKAVETALTRLAAIEARADGALAVSWTRNSYFRDRGYTHAVVADFVDEAAVERWVASAPHDEAAALLNSFADTFCVVDLEEPYRHGVR